ncbi:DNA photolyase family protein [Porticoccaceae bacterium]|nr:DNA photolyase family protein [Porticoccaceae bacterium]
MWFRQDLRLADNPALAAACDRGAIIPIYILDDKGAGEHAMGAASRWWLHQALEDLNNSLNGGLQLYRGDALTLLSELVEQTEAGAVLWNRCYEPWRIARDGKIKGALKDRGIAVESFNGSLLWEPWSVLKSDQTPYKVFTPYYRRGCLAATAPRMPLGIPKNIQLYKNSGHSLMLSELELMPQINWHEQMRARWTVSEAAAQQRLDEFVSDELQDYRDGRNFPDKQNVSRLSPYLHFGQLSPNTAWHRAAEAGAFITNEQSLDTFMSELGWREFSYYLLYHFPKLPTDNLQARFDLFPWAENTDADLKAWQRGKTGYPLVDAGMRELYTTGYMHNRVRMVVGSFLVKNLLIHWHQGEAWFWDCLVDADLASNSAGWQWIAGCGADAAPFFRIFNPITQSEKFDKQGNYIRRYVPELATMPDKYIHAPWLAPAEVLASAGVDIGINYPAPIVDIKESRERALAAFAVTKIQPAEN